jgi:hemolysin activation/secretion protein
MSNLAPMTNTLDCNRNLAWLKAILYPLSRPPCIASIAGGLLREKRRPDGALLCLLSLASIVAHAPVAHAQQVPDAGRALRESVPAHAAPDLESDPARIPRIALPPVASPSVPSSSAASQTLMLKSISFNGNTVFSDDMLAALVADKVGSDVTFSDLQILAARITEHYRRAGYVLAQTVIPVQDVGTGNVAFSVLEGVLGRVRIERLADIPLPDGIIEKVLSRLEPGKPVTQRALERAILLLSDLPGLALQSSLEAGDDAATFDLVIEVKPAPRVNFSLDIDNFGSIPTGEYRIGAMGRINSPLGLGDNLDLRWLDSFGSGLVFGRIAYELPLGYAGTRASVAISRIEYELGKDFAALGASGHANVAELALTHPLLRSRAHNVFAKISVDKKILNDNIDLLAQASDKRLQSLGAGVVYEGRDNWLRGGYTGAGLTLYRGQLDIRSVPELALDQDPAGRNTNGHYTRATYQLNRLQSVSDNTSIYLALAGQWANNNLDSADKITIGGPHAVRAFGVSSGIGDEAQIVNAEYRWSASAAASISLFYDIGRVRLNHRPYVGEENHRVFSGYGLSTFWNIMTTLSLRASLAWPAHDGGRAAGENNQRVPRFYGQMVKVF